MRISWIQNTRDYRIDYTRFALIEAARRGEIRYKEITAKKALQLGISQKVLDALREGLSAFVLESQQPNQKPFFFIVDTSDGFNGFSPAVEDVDCYFTVAYLPSLFEQMTTLTPHTWQRAYMLDHYQKSFQDLIQSFGIHFSRVHPFILHQCPMWNTRAKGFWQITLRKIQRIIQRRRFGVFPLLDWAIRFSFEHRYRQILALRKLPLKYDAVALDTLWAWPGHRVALHKKLKDAKDQGKKIFHKLSLITTLDQLELGENGAMKRSWLPELIQPIQLESHYEEMIASSRVFLSATGKHWGYREIGFIALAAGTPLYMDPPLYRSYFDLKTPGGSALANQEPQIFMTRNEWEEFDQILDQIDDLTWNQARAKNQDFFDKNCSPPALAAYLIDCMRQLIEKRYPSDRC